MLPLHRVRRRFMADQCMGIPLTRRHRSMCNRTMAGMETVIIAITPTIPASGITVRAMAMAIVAIQEVTAGKPGIGQFVFCHNPLVLAMGVFVSLVEADKGITNQG